LLRSNHRTRRVVWITGASSGIGAALAESFASRGDVVVASARSAAGLARLKRSIERASGTCHAIACDVREERQVARAASKIAATLGRVDILVNNAGVTSFKSFLSTSVGEFDNVVSTSLRALYLATRAVLPSMLRRKRGIVLNILSYAAKTTYTNSAAYAAAKSGAEAMMNVVRAETRHAGIKVVNVYPGAVLTPMWPSRIRRRSAREMMTPAEIADLITSLTLQPESMQVEEIIIRPQGGDLKV
jgi:NADP-dependent 3-hydroxy acid dehydrogenase YdfG